MRRVPSWHDRFHGYGHSGVLVRRRCARVPSFRVVPFSFPGFLLITYLPFLRRVPSLGGVSFLGGVPFLGRVPFLGGVSFLAGTSFLAGISFLGGVLFLGRFIGVSVPLLRVFPLLGFPLPLGFVVLAGLSV
jgi:hypothetical protein